MTKRTAKGSRFRRFLLILIPGILLSVGLVIYLGPRFLVREATRSPQQSGTFVTRSIEQKPLQFKLQDSLSEPLSEPAETMPQTSEAYTETQENFSEQEISQAETQVGAAYSAEHPTERQTPIASDTWDSSGRDSEPNSTELPSRSVPATESRTERPRPQKPAARNLGQQFAVQISENEISSLIYSGLSQGIAPQFRQSLQGVSTRIQTGKATISVALLPKYLPEAFLKNLPGVTRQTPTIYMGGEVSLSQQGNTVQPVIHRINLGAIRLPMPFVQSAMQSQVQAYIRQMLTLPDGRQAQLSQVQLQSGAIHLKGHVD